jgi:hypothetical protein
MNTVDSFEARPSLLCKGAALSLFVYPFVEVPYKCPDTEFKKLARLRPFALLGKSSVTKNREEWAHFLFGYGRKSGPNGVVCIPNNYVWTSLIPEGLLSMPPKYYEAISNARAGFDMNSRSSEWGVTTGIGEYDCLRKLFMHLVPRDETGTIEYDDLHSFIELGTFGQFAISKDIVATYHWIRESLEPFVIGLPRVSSGAVNDGTSQTSKSRLANHVKNERKKVTPKLRRKILDRDGYKCVDCGRSPRNDPSCVLHVDHRQAVSKRGFSVEDNLQTLCDWCNLGKGADTDWKLKAAKL